MVSPCLFSNSLDLGSGQGSLLLADPVGNEAQSLPVIHRMRSLTAREAKIQTVYKWCSTLASVSNLTYTIFDRVRAVDLNGQEWKVSFLKRQSGIGIQGKPVIYLEKDEMGIFSVPGTVDENDWVSNVYGEQQPTFRSTPFSCNSDDSVFVNSEFAIHGGFLAVAESIIKNLLDARSGRLFAEKREIHFTGHSQGAAVASILALYAQTHRRLLCIAPECEISCITFGSPRVFSKGAFDFYMQKVPETYRVFNSLDPVSRVPLGRSGFKHVGHKIELSSLMLEDAVRTDVAGDLSASLQLDANAIGGIIASVGSLVFSPITWLVGKLTVPHSMDHYETIVNSRDSIVSILQELRPYTPPPPIEEKEVLVEDSPVVQGARVRYTPPKGDQEEGSLAFTYPITPESVSPGDQPEPDSPV